MRAIIERNDPAAVHEFPRENHVVLGLNRLLAELDPHVVRNAGHEAVQLRLVIHAVGDQVVGLRASSHCVGNFAIRGIDNRVGASTAAEPSRGARTASTRASRTTRSAGSRSTSGACAARNRRPARSASRGATRTCSRGSALTSASATTSRCRRLDTGNAARLYAAPEAGHIGLTVGSPWNGTGRHSLLAATFAAEPATAFTAWSGSILAGNRGDHEDRGYRCRGDQSHHRTRN